MTADVKAIPEQLISSGRSVGGLLLQRAAQDGDRTMLIVDDGDATRATYSRAQVVERASALGAFLKEHGVGRGDRIHLHMSNREEFLFAWFAAALIGASIVPTNTAGSVDELAYTLEHSGAALSIVDDEAAEHIARAHEQAGASGEILRCDADALLDLPAAELPPPTATADDELAIMYTSGTTSRPKGVIVSHANYIYAGETVAKASAMRADDRALIVLPLFHANAQYYSTMSVLATGATLVLVAARFSATRFADQCRRNAITVASLFAAPIRMILAQEPKKQWRENELRVVLFAQNIRAEEVEAWDSRIGGALVQLYGMTETMGPPLVNPLGPERRADCVGRPVMGYSCRIVSPEGTDVQPGEPGELLVRGVPGVSITRGYLDNPEATSETITDGWLHTGDVMRIASDGYFEFVDRDKDMIKRSGENVAASEVERVLLDHEAVQDVAVIGVPDPIRDEQIVAYVVLDQPAEGDELIAWCAERLAAFRVPSHVRAIDSLPRTSVGKIRKPDLRAEWSAEQDRLKGAV